MTPQEPAVTDDTSVIMRSGHEPEAFSALFTRHAATIQRYVTRRLGPDAADDVVADTFLLAFRQRDSYDPARPDALPWLYGIATNLIGRHRGDEVRLYRALARTGADEVTAPFTDQVDSAVTASMASRRLAAALARLPAAYRDPLHASAVALAAKPVSPGQWVYRKATITIIKAKGVHGRDTTNENWQTADGLHSAWYYHGQLSVYATPTEGKDISYAELAKLPASPAALAKYIYGREQQILGPEPANLNWQMTFNEITGLFSYFALSPKVAAALLAALPSIPGVRVVKDAGSIAFIRSNGNLDTEKVILSPSTYTVTGVVLAGPVGGSGKQGAFSAWIPVSGPGARP